MNANLILINVSFTSDGIIFYVVEALANFPEHPYNQCFELYILDSRLLCCILFSSFSGVLTCSFIWAMFLGLLILAASLCLFLCIRQSCHDSLSW